MIFTVSSFKNKVPPLFTHYYVCEFHLCPQNLLLCVAPWCLISTDIGVRRRLCWSHFLLDHLIYLLRDAFFTWFQINHMVSFFLCQVWISSSYSNLSSAYVITFSLLMSYVNHLFSKLKLAPNHICRVFTSVYWLHFPLNLFSYDDCAAAEKWTTCLQR